jgi:hypothetical protein
VINLTKLYFVDGKKVLKKEFDRIWKTEGYHYISEGKKIPISPPNRYGAWQGIHKYSIRSKNPKKVILKNPKNRTGRGDFFSAKYDEWGGYWTVVFNPIGVHSGRYSEREAREGAQKSNVLFSTSKARSNRFVGKTMKGYSASGKVIWEKKILSVSTSHPEMKAGTHVALLSDGKQVFGRDEDFQRWTKKKPRVKKNPKIPTKEFWNEVFPQVYGYYKKKGLAFAKKRGYKSVKELASATTASIWYEKISPKRKAVYEKVRRKREGIVRSNPLVEYYKIKIRR